jgi:hypothetical protein
MCFTSLRYAFDGKVLSMRFTLVCCFDCRQRFAARAFVRAVNAWMMAAALRGIGSRSSGGRSFGGEEFAGPSAAAFASSSAASLPSMPICPGVQRTVMFVSAASFSSTIFCRKTSTAHWPRPCRYRRHPRMTAWLSTPSDYRIQ